ncbi:MAG TPA: DMT family transporter [Methylomirabilota bacterium]
MLFVTIATLCFVTMNVTVKVLIPHLPTLELIWARALGHLLVVFALFAPGHGGWRLLVTRRPAIQLGRSVLLLLSTSFFFTALGPVPLADATAVSFTSPLLVAALAFPVLGERVGLSQWGSIAVGFVGALIVIRPTGEGASPYAFLVVGSAVCYALYQLLTRRVAGVDAPETSVTYSALVATLVLSALVPFFWQTPQRLGHWLMLATLGLLGAVGHYCVARALLWAPASIVSPFHYVQLVWASALGYLVFGDVPSAWMWLGAAIIVASGLSIVVRETRVAREPRAVREPGRS